MERTQVPPELRRGRNWLAAIIVSGHTLKHIYMSGLQAILLPEIKIGLGLSATQLGSLAFSRQAMGWVTTMGAGYIGDRFPQRSSAILGTSLALLGVSYFLVGITPTYWLMLAAMLLVGVGPAMYHPPALGVLSRRFPDARGLATSLHGTGGTVGEMLGPLVAAGLLSLLAWRGILQWGVVPAVLGGFLMWTLMRSAPGETPGTSSMGAYLTALFRLLARRPIQILVLTTALRSFGQNGVMIFLPIYLREDLEFSPTRVAVYLSLTQVVGIGAQPAMGYLSDMFGRRAVLIPAMGALGLLFLAMRFAEPGVQLILTVMALGGFLYSLHEISIAAAMDVAGEGLQATMASLIYGASFLGAVSPVFAGMVVDATGATSDAFIYGAGFVLLGALILPWLKLPKTGSRATRQGI